ncbi:MAG: hypothetical protein DMG70_16330 [Acidobacteria bacterium]|nr:MAG: hypothetical protein DMG70_16330 [Acidobacteriota bacterium]PYY05566.1 MAG: hypothetical protein DMG69_26265 [Acidobacteriota bacterium]
MASSWKPIDRVLRCPLREAGRSGNIWDRKTLGTWIEQKYDITVGVGQCQRLFRQPGFRLRKPRPALAQASSELRRLHEEGRRRPLGEGRSPLSAAWLPLPDVWIPPKSRVRFSGMLRRAKV